MGNWSILMNSRCDKCLHYLKENPGSGFVLAFMFLLIVCAVLLIFGQEKIAGGVSNWAYLFLVIGVVIKLIRILREREDV